MSTAVHRSPNKLWRSNSIFNLWVPYVLRPLFRATIAELYCNCFTYLYSNSNYKQWDFLNFFMYCIQHCFICRPSDSTVSEDAGIEPRTVAASAHWQSDPLTTRLALISNFFLGGGGGFSDCQLTTISNKMATKKWKKLGLCYYATRNPFFSFSFWD
jgi:hypothetical protein